MPLYKIFAFGVAPTYLALRHNEWLWWLGYALALIVLYLLVWFHTNLSSAHNIVMAQVTYSRLTEEDKNLVELIAENLLCAYEHDFSAEFENDYQKMSYFALAMRDMDVDPSICFSSWFDIKNPSRIPSDLWIVFALGWATKAISETQDSNGLKEETVKHKSQEKPE